MTGESPRAPSVVSRTREPKPTCRTSANLEQTSALPRTVSPSLHPCSASGGASGFLLASALAHHEALRPPSGQDARCVQPTSATHTKRACTRTFVRSRLAPRLSPRGGPGGSGPYGTRPGIRVVHDTRDRFGELRPDTRVCASRAACGLSARDPRPWAFSSHGARCIDASGTSVASLSSVEVRSAFALPLPEHAALLHARALHVREPPRPP